MKKDIWKILAHHIEVVSVDSDMLEGLGASVYSHNVIQISNELEYSQYIVTLLHEFIHYTNGELSEINIDCIAQILAQVLIDNKEKVIKLLNKGR